MSPSPLPDADRPMRVALALLTLVPGGMGGSETYARAIARELTRRPELDVTVLVTGAAAGITEGRREVVADRLANDGSTRGRLETLARGGAPWFAARSALDHVDVVHYPLTVPIPLRRRATPMVQTMLDVQHLDLPELFSRAERAYRVFTYDRPARRADIVITISEFCKDQLVTHLGIDPGRIRVAYLGVDAGLFRPHDGPRDPFVLYPARGWPHKNHARLIDAVRRLRDLRPGLRLVLTGGAAPSLGPLPDWVEHRGLVSETELRDLYRAASCLAFPSLYEGFGLPPLEAMASGCPVASATSGSLPEICGDAAVLFDPRDVEAMAAAIATAIDSRERLAPLGLARSRTFTWAACADVHAEVYRDLTSPVTRS